MCGKEWGDERKGRKSIEKMLSAADREVKNEQKLVLKCLASDFSEPGLNESFVANTKIQKYFVK